MGGVPLCRTPNLDVKRLLSSCCSNVVLLAKARRLERWLDFLSRIHSETTYRNNRDQTGVMWEDLVQMAVGFDDRGLTLLAPNDYECPSREG